MLLDMTVQKVAIRPLHFDDREPVGANVNALLEKLKIDIVRQSDVAEMFGDRLITLGMVADRAQRTANRPGLLERQKPARLIGLVDHRVAAGGWFGHTEPILLEGDRFQSGVGKGVLWMLNRLLVFGPVWACAHL